MYVTRVRDTCTCCNFNYWLLQSTT